MPRQFSSMREPPRCADIDQSRVHAHGIIFGPQSRDASRHIGWRATQIARRAAFCIATRSQNDGPRMFLYKELTMSLSMILLIVLILLLIGAIPSWPHSRNWGYGPSGGLGVVILIIVVLLVLGRI